LSSPTVVVVKIKVAVEEVIDVVAVIVIGQDGHGGGKWRRESDPYLVEEGVRSVLDGREVVTGAAAYGGEGQICTWERGGKGGRV
jgi:hypothetical protein